MNENFHDLSVDQNTFSPIANSTVYRDPKRNDKKIRADISEDNDHYERVPSCFIKKTEKDFPSATVIEFSTETTETPKKRPQDISKLTILDKLLENKSDSVNVTRFANEYIEKAYPKNKENPVVEDSIKLFAKTTSLLWIGVNLNERTTKELIIVTKSSTTLQAKISTIAENFSFIQGRKLSSAIDVSLLPKVENRITVVFLPTDHWYCSGNIVVECQSKKFKVHLFGYACPAKIVFQEPKRLLYNSENEESNRSVEMSLTNVSPRTAFIYFYDVYKSGITFRPRKFLVHPDETRSVEIILPRIEKQYEYGVLYVDEGLRRATKEYCNKDPQKMPKLFNDLRIFFPCPGESDRNYEKWRSTNYVPELNKQIEKNFFEKTIELSKIKYLSREDCRLLDSVDVFTMDGLTTVSFPNLKVDEDKYNNVVITNYIKNLRTSSKGELTNVLIEKNEYEFPETPIKSKSVIGIVIQNPNGNPLSWSIVHINPHDYMAVIGESKGTMSDNKVIPIQFQPPSVGKFVSEFIVRVWNNDDYSQIENLIKMTGFCTSTAATQLGQSCVPPRIPGFKAKREIVFEIQKHKTPRKISKPIKISNDTKHVMEIFTWAQSPFQIKRHIKLEVHKQSVKVVLNVKNLTKDFSSHKLIFFDIDGNASVTTLFVRET